MKELKLLTEIKSSNEQVKDKFFVFNYNLSPDKSKHFSIMINSNWRFVQIEEQKATDESPISQIALIKRIIAPEAEIEIFIDLIPKEIHPADYLKLFLKNDGFEIIDSREVHTMYGIIGDFLTKQTMNEQIIVMRSLCIKDANKIIRINCKTYLDNYEELEEEFLLAIQTLNC
jgi:hypothetical protein